MSTTEAQAPEPTPIAMTRCDSSQIHSIGYDATSSTLAIRFHRGTKEYRYSGVPAGVASDFAAAASKGSFFGSFIRNVYPFGYHPLQEADRPRAEDEPPRRPLTEGDALADQQGKPRPDNPSGEATEMQLDEQAALADEGNTPD